MYMYIHTCIIYIDTCTLIYTNVHNIYIYTHTGLQAGIVSGIGGGPIGMPGTFPNPFAVMGAKPPVITYIIVNLS
jgi:hypothetical protein